jgi:hypothetical protein
VGQPTKLSGLRKKDPALRTTRVLLALAIASAATGAVAVAQSPAPRDPTKPCPGAINPLPGETCGDNYLESVRIATSNVGKGILGFSDSVNTSKATLQADLFKPGGNHAGPREPFTCGGAVYGKTVWYDLNPTVDGDVLVQAVGNGFNPVMSIVEYDATDQPNFRPKSAFQCSNQGGGALEQLTKKHVRRGHGYSVQLGGVGNTGGPVDFDVNLTPYRLRATSKIAFQLTDNGIKLVNVRVKVNRKARVEVGCKGCGKRVKRGRNVRFNFRGKALRAGGKITIRATRGGEIGVYQSRKIKRGKTPTESDRCLNPGSKKPRKTCP